MIQNRKKTFLIESTTKELVNVFPSQLDLANYLGVTKQMISKVKNDHRKKVKSYLVCDVYTYNRKYANKI